MTSTTLFGSLQASTLSIPDFDGSEWVKTFSYTVESSQQIGNKPPSLLNIYVPNTSKNLDVAMAVYSTGEYTHLFSDDYAEKKVLKISLWKYFRILDLATKQTQSWDEFTYDRLGHCYMPSQRISFNGRTQNIVSICGYDTKLPMVSKTMEALSKELKRLMNRTKEKGENFN